MLGLTASVGGAARIAGPVIGMLLFILGAVLFALCAAGAMRLRTTWSPGAAARRAPHEPRSQRAPAGPREAAARPRERDV